MVTTSRRGPGVRVMAEVAHLAPSHKPQDSEPKYKTPGTLASLTVIVSLSSSFLTLAGGFAGCSISMPTQCPFTFLLISSTFLAALD